jgi:hypothetical protein
MKSRIYPTLALAVFCVAALGARLSAGIFTDDFRMLVVAEQFQPSSASQDSPLSFVVLDGGYIEAGDPIAGDNPPSPTVVAQALQSALAEHGFRAAEGTPSIVITYHWGVLRVDHRQINTPYQIKTNLQARIELVSTQKLGAEVENHILGREKGAGMDETASAPRILVGSLETIRQDSRMPRIFVVATAYDYQALSRHEPARLWTTKLSAQETSGGMDTVIPALIASGGQYFGKELPDIRDVGVSPAKMAQPVATSANIQTSSDLFRGEKEFVDNLLKQEHIKISGQTD